MTSVRIANCSGFLGDRFSAPAEVVAGGAIDVLTGDWLAELTMLILARQKAKDPGAGYARPFVQQLRDVLAECVDRGIRIVANAGGLNPAGCADAVRRLAADLGVDAVVAHVEGDDLLPRLAALQASGEELRNLDTGQRLADLDADVVSANAYLGGWAIAEALAGGAHVVVTGRVTDAAVVVGPAAWWHGWARDDWDALAGAVVAGHAIECGAQVTGGNYAFFGEVPGLEHAGFPIAEVGADGSSVITKHPGSGGAVTVGTVTAQLLYEIQGTRYVNPDVVARFDTIQLTQEGEDRVRIDAVQGEPPPPQTKVALNYVGGYRNSMTFVLSGLDIDAKAALAERTLWQSLPGGRDGFESAAAELVKGEGEGLGLLHVTVLDRDAAKVGRAFSNKVIEMALASYPGLFTLSPPRDAQPYGVYWPALVDSSFVTAEVVMDAGRTAVAPVATSPVVAPEAPAPATVTPGLDWGPIVRRRLGEVAGARSGDKGGNANIGVWARTRDEFEWLASYLTPERVAELLPETAGCPIERHELPRMLALNFVVRGLLGLGVAASTRLDSQAKGLGERLRAAWMDVPEELVAARHP